MCTSDSLDANVVAQFHRLYYESGCWKQTYWKGVRSLKCPLDLWTYQEILFDIRPSTVIELGTRYGGTTLFLADMLELLGKGRVISVDLAAVGMPVHLRACYITGNSTDFDTLARVQDSIEESPVMVISDSDHAMEHVLRELELYSPLVTLGSYFIVEDTNLRHLVRKDHEAGPREAVDEFLQRHPEFEVDRRREKFLLTFNPFGYLKRVK